MRAELSAWPQLITQNLELRTRSCVGSGAIFGGKRGMRLAPSPHSLGAAGPPTGLRLCLLCGSIPCLVLAYIRQPNESIRSPNAMSIPRLMETRRYDGLETQIFADSGALGAQAAADLASILEVAIAQRGFASVVLATGNSQLRFMEQLRRRQDIAWPDVIVFHMDEYLGMPEDHSASFRH